MSKFTPGPWPIPHIARDDITCNCPYVLAGEYMGSIATISVDNGLLASEGGNDCPPLEVAKANAHLIAAAPEMYDFIATLENDDGKIPDWLWEKRNQVLAKARGEVEA